MEDDAEDCDVGTGVEVRVGVTDCAVGSGVEVAVADCGGVSGVGVACTAVAVGVDVSGNEPDPTVMVDEAETVGVTSELAAAGTGALRG